MKIFSKTVKILLISMVFLFLTAGLVFSQTLTLEGLKSKVDDFSNSLAKSLPFNSTIGLNWSDAYIGQLLSVPPHFGVGFSAGFTTMDSASIGKMLEEFDFDLPFDLGGFPVIGYTVEARVGGIILPFDVGFKFGLLDLDLGSMLGMDKLKIDYLLVGGDIRYKLLDQKLIIPKISVGLGYNYLKGGISLPVGSGLDYTFDINGTPYNISLSQPEAGILWETSTLDFKAQASWSLIIISPYIGVGVSHAWSKAGYEIKSDVSGDILQEDIKNIFGIDISDTNMSSINNVTGWSSRVFGGLSFNIAVLKLDITGMYNLSDSQYGVTVGVRVQL